MDPATLSALIGGASTVLGAAVKNPGAPAYSSATGFTTFDSSNWTVALGGSQATGAPHTATDLGQVSPLLIVAALVGFLIWKKHNKSA